MLVVVCIVSRTGEEVILLLGSVIVTLEEVLGLIVGW